MAIGAGCKIAKIAELPVTMIDMHPMVTAQINGVEAMFIADSGAFYSMLSRASAAEFKLSTFPAPFGLFVRGVGGATSRRPTTPPPRKRMSAFASDSTTNTPISCLSRWPSWICGLPRMAMMRGWAALWETDAGPRRYSARI
jgi:hypothetical protein